MRIKVFTKENYLFIIIVMLLLQASCCIVEKNVSLPEKNNIFTEKLSGSNNIDFGKVIMYLNWSNSTFRSPLFQRGDELFIAIPDDFGKVHVSNTVKIKGKLISSYDYDYSMGGATCINNNNTNRTTGYVFASVTKLRSDYIDRESVLWVSSLQDQDYYLTCYHLERVAETMDVNIKELCSVKTDTPIIIEAVNDYVYNENITSFIVCQSPDYKKVAYYDVSGKILNSYNFDGIMIVRTRDTQHKQTYGFDGKSIFILTQANKVEDQFKVTQRYDIGEGLDLGNSECWSNNNLLFVLCQSKLVVIESNFFVNNQMWMLAKFNNVEKVFKAGNCFQTTDGVYYIEYDSYKNMPIETKLFDIKKGVSYSYHNYWSLYDRDKFCKIFTINDSGRSRLLCIKKRVILTLSH